MQSCRKSGLGLPGDNSSVLGHAGSAGPKDSSQKHAKMWTQGLQKHWARRDVQQPSNLKPSWLIRLRAALQGNTSSTLAKKEVRLSCSSQPPAAFALPSRKGCWDANKVFSNPFWPSSRTIRSSLTATTRSRNLYFEEYQPVPLPPGTSELRHCKAASRIALLYGQPSSGPVFS